MRLPSLYLSKYDATMRASRVVLSIMLRFIFTAIAFNITFDCLNCVNDLSSDLDIPLGGHPLLASPLPARYGSRSPVVKRRSEARRSGKSRRERRREEDRKVCVVCGYEARGKSDSRMHGRNVRDRKRERTRIRTKEK